MFFFFFFNDTATTEIYTLSLHDALPISRKTVPAPLRLLSPEVRDAPLRFSGPRARRRHLLRAGTAGLLRRTRTRPIDSLHDPAARRLAARLRGARLAHRSRESRTPVGTLARARLPADSDGGAPAR